MAKVGSRSRLYQHQQQQQQHQKVSAPATGTSIFPSALATTSDFISSRHHLSTMHHSPATRHQTNGNLVGNPTLLNPQMRDLKQPAFQQLISTSASLAHLQPNQFPTNNMESSNHLRQQQQLQQQLGNHTIHEQAGFDYRSKSSAILNLIASKQHQQNTNNLITQRSTNLHSNSSSGHSQDFGKFRTSGFRVAQDHSMPLSESKPAFSELW